MGLKSFIENMEHHFEPGGKLQNTIRSMKRLPR